MCNSIHKRHTVPKHKSGKAWKLFSSTDEECWYTAIATSHERYTINPDGWIVWDESKLGDGFCLLPTKREAEKLCENWNKAFEDFPLSQLKIVQVEYRGATARQDDYIVGYDRTYQTLLVKAFRPLV